MKNKNKELSKKPDKEDLADWLKDGFNSPWCETDKPKVSKEFVSGWWCKLSNNITQWGDIKLQDIQEMLQEAGVEVEE